MRSAVAEALTLATDQAPPLRTARTSAEWVAYFRANAARVLDVPWHEGAGTVPPEVLASLRAWQLGETSDGSRLRAAAQRHAERTNDPAFAEAVELFIAEEQRHGAALGRFLDLAGVPRLRWYWGDAAFRLFRHFLGRIESCATVVVMVEVHALLYYAAVRRTGGSVVLGCVCHQILRDEVAHIRFQCERLALLRRAHGGPRRALSAVVHTILFTGITLAVWWGHRRALRAGGWSVRRYWRAAWGKMRTAWNLMRPETYRWPTERAVSETSSPVPASNGGK
jgi:hypothetical protein